jgi:hypothetical protein
MPIYTYEKDFRDLDGEVTSATDLIQNIDDIQDEINDLSWENVERGSLDQFHAKPGEPYKEVQGRYVVNSLSMASAYPNFYKVATLSFPVEADSGVFVSGNISFQASREVSPGTSGVSRFEVHVAARDDQSGQQIGEWKLTKGYGFDANGGLRINWGYMSPGKGTNTVSLSFSRHTGENPSNINPLRASLTSFVVNR